MLRKRFIFHSKYGEVNSNTIAVKIQTVRLQHTDHVKYLGLFTDEAQNFIKEMEFYLNLDILFQNLH